MLTKNNISLLFLFGCLFFISCEEDYNLEAKDFESKLVVNALFSADTPWSVHVSKSHNILDPNTRTEFVSNAHVEIFNDKGEWIYDLEHDGGGFYKLDDVAPSPTRCYQIKVSASGYKPVTAKSYVPEKSKLKIKEFTVTQEDEKDELTVDFSIEDKSNVEAYYIWEIVSLEKDDVEGTQVSPNKLSDNWLNDLTSDPENLIDNKREIIGAGAFGGGTYSGTYDSRYAGENSGTRNLDDDGFPDSEDNDDLVDGDPVGDEEDEDEEVTEYHYELRVMSISKELYDYYSSVEEYLTYNTNNSQQPPLSVYSNINNGLGVFAGYSESIEQF